VSPCFLAHDASQLAHSVPTVERKRCYAALKPPITLAQALQVALMAVSALTVLLSNCLEESQFVSSTPGRKRLVLEGPQAGAQQAALLGSDSDTDAAGEATHPR